MDLTKTSDLNQALAGLLGKYEVEVAQSWRLCDASRPGDEVPAGGLTLGPGWLDAETDLSEACVPLRPWRSERRFVELKRLIDEQTVSPLLMCRFACLTDGSEMPLEAILYREFDLVEWISGARIVRIYASMAESEKVANVLVRLANEVICSVEAATTLPPGTPIQDRHEMIARRGVASDRVVDTQVPQSSVYLFGDAQTEQFTDTDAELFGLDSGDVALVRSAYEALSRPENRGEMRRDHARLRRLVGTAYESVRQGRRLNLEGGSR